MITTFELRWFQPQHPSTEFQEWFKSDCPGEWWDREAQRDDWYIVPRFPCDYLNLKLREGRFEVKWRKAELEPFERGNWHGRVEKWVKWTCEDDPDNLFAQPAMIVDEGNWVRVQKVRSRKSISLQHSCEVELTHLQIQNEAWWSFALEVTGGSLNHLQTLNHVAQSLAQSCPNFHLIKEKSFAYPEWLSRWS